MCLFSVCARVCVHIVCICNCMCTWNCTCYFWVFIPPSVVILYLYLRAHVCVNVYDLLCVFVLIYAPNSSCTHVRCEWHVLLWACLDPHLYSVWLFILPVFLMVQKRIRRCWLFVCQSFHMQPLPPLLTPPLILDHRWKSSSRPADAFRFWWAFLFSSQGAESSRTTSFIDRGENRLLLSFQYSHFLLDTYVQFTAKASL